MSKKSYVSVKVFTTTFSDSFLYIQDGVLVLRLQRKKIIRTCMQNSKTLSILKEHLLKN